MSLHEVTINGILGAKLRAKGTELTKAGFYKCGGEFACAGAGKLEKRNDGPVLYCGNRHELMTVETVGCCNRRTNHQH